jgi:NAD(P)H-nitrite reductase large subunit
VRRYLIVGNGAAGATAGEEIRGRDPQGEITIVSAERWPMYSRPGLAYVIIGEIPAKQVIARRTEWYAQQRIRLVYGRVASVEPGAHCVHLAGGQRLGYDRLLICTGARAVPLPYPGSDLAGVVYLDTLDGTQDLLHQVGHARRAVVVGGGITALEMAEGFAHHKLETHYFVRRETLWSTVFNRAESALLAERMSAHGVHIHFNTEASEVLGDKRRRVAGVRLAGGESLACDLVGAAIGVKPQLDAVRGTAIRVDRGILVDEYLESNEADVFAAGDCAQIWDRWTQQHNLDVLWPSAVAGGRAAGINLAGGSQPYVKGTPFNACLLFGLHITAVGQLGGARDDDGDVLQHMSRGSSEVWATRPHAYASAWSQIGPNSLRLILSGDQIAGALIIGDQSLADALRGLIEQQVDVSALQPALKRGGPEMGPAILGFWQRCQSSNGRLRSPAPQRPAAGSER